MVLTHKTLCLGFRSLGLIHFLLGRVGLGGILGLLGLVVFAQGLRLGDELRVLVIEHIERIPVLQEVVERSRAQHDVQKRGLAVAVHAARAAAQALLELCDAHVVLVDLRLGLVHLR